MYVMNDKSILSHPEPLSQDEIETTPLQNGLRVLARMIARDLVRQQRGVWDKTHPKMDTHQTPNHDEV
jgi:hypothetical protein